jgi:tRNA(fMet)-specific endonuclease VapC
MKATDYRTMLDTNIVSDLIRNPHGKVAARLTEHGEDGICLGIITAAELRYGAAKKGSARLKIRVEGVLERVDVLPFDKPCDIEYGALRANLEEKGTPIGPTDLFIAAHALALKVALITNNSSEFRRVPGLVVENWLA